VGGKGRRWGGGERSHRGTGGFWIMPTKNMVSSAKKAAKTEKIDAGTGRGSSVKKKHNTGERRRIKD